jgi:hypothetical protein
MMMDRLTSLHSLALISLESSKCFSQGSQILSSPASFTGVTLWWPVSTPYLFSTFFFFFYFVIIVFFPRLISAMTNKRVQIETLQLLSILLPKENREIAACLLKFLSMVSLHKDINKMDTKNIALVFAPTLFGDKRRKALKPSQADIDKDLQRQNKIAEVLQVMIDCQSVLWMLPIDLQEQLEYTLQGNKTVSPFFMII